ncbi:MULTISPECIES: hypothetical protein [Streptomyces]|nr:MULTISPECIES: hypothetical protein [Streptomyces]KUN56727.1 hypothetical protein AQJ43_03850 [Streptomyces avermitilis]MYS99156.1 hypothetical protein [Streptomyces sp. SID5469]OOV32549.1 hypothetical protein SM007_06920 [Streptomyces avermitilis]GDY76352.1 hypothetical protein SAV31267_058370 [Streptomyces avermitilis]GDY85300.1 hypothetical protein SAVCW2_44990 [Streptomyces avermitilis]
MPAVSSTQSAYAVLRFGRIAAMGTVAVLILIAGVWGSWGTAQHVMLTKGRERGTMTVARCSGDRCTGPYVPATEGSKARARVVIEQPVAVRRGEVLTVVVKPGSDQVVRTGPAGVLYAWVPLGGALLLASVVVAGGLRMARTAWALAGSGLVLLTAAFAALQ